MSLDVGNALWPLAGLRWLLLHPSLWWRPLAAHALALLLMLSIGVAVSCWLWPAPQAWWWHTAKAAGALATGAVLAISAWMLIVPLLLAVVLDALATAVFREHGLPDIPVPIHRSASAGVAVLLRTLPLRLRWLGVAVIGLFTGPAAPLIASYALARVAVVDAYDIALGVRGLDSTQRMAIYAAERNDLRRAAVTAGAIQLGLAFTFIGWLLWLPALVCGAALHTAARNRSLQQPLAPEQLTPL